MGAAKSAVTDVVRRRWGCKVGPDISKISLMGQ